MNQTNIDHLFQLTAASAPRPGDNARQSLRPPAFDNLFSLASAMSPDSGRKIPNHSEHTQQERYAPTNVAAPYESQEGPPPDRPSSSSGAQVQVNENVVPAEASVESDPADENSDRDGHIAATEQSADKDDDSPKHNEIAELPNEGEAPISTVARTASSAPVEPISAAVATDAEQQPAEKATGKNLTKEQNTEQSPQVKEAVKRVAHPTNDAIAPANDAEQSEQPASTDQPENSSAAKSRKPAHAEEASRAVATDEAQQNRASQTAGRRAAAGKSPVETQAAVSISTPGETGDELAATRRAEVTTTSDEPFRRESAPVTSRAPSRIEAAVPVASAVAASHGGDATTAKSENSTGRPTNATSGKADTLSSVLGRHQSGASSMGRARGAAGEDESPRVDPARFIGRVAKAFETAQERGGTLQLRLSPPELGSLRLELTVKEGVMTASLETESTTARRILLDHLPALRERLAEQNIRIERFDVDVRRDGGGSQTDGRPAQQQQHNDQPDQPPPRREPVAQPRIGESATREAPVIQNAMNDTQINLVV